MRTTTAPTIRLSDYQEPPFWIDTVDLFFDLHPTKTRVHSKITFRANPSRSGDGPHDLRLDGRGLKLLSASIDGTELEDGLIDFDDEGLTLKSEYIPQSGFEWDAVVQINPEANTALEGLYMSNGMYCTQCEAQGFRKITYFLDRPDVMATYRVQINGDMPVKLSNGNPINAGIWHDPWKKPAYLFALVAGDLVSYDDGFTTGSGKHVDLKIYVRPGDEGKCAYAMDALKRSMRWDEQVYGREYDLDIFQIVAVDDFNMGAMENKGLNIFNSKYVLASPETATDRDYELIEGIIAHEYFHNWTGNRITCRDWFQLCLKEGLTVFRDQQFSGDMRSHAVKRIDDVLMLRARQFREDAGPLAHPVRPEEYIEINNFYTATVYEKGAEVIGMLKTLVGDEGYSKALDLYFERHDGQACTIEDWIKVFEDACETDLSQFKLWYSQAGTPHLSAEETFSNGTYTLKLAQETKPTPGQDEKSPVVLPLRLAAYSQSGQEIISERVEVLRDVQAEIAFDGLSEKPILSLNRGFSAPVTLGLKQSNADRLLLMAHDTDPFNAWEAGYRTGMNMIVGMVLNDDAPDPEFIEAIGTIMSDSSRDPAYRALAIGLPTEDAIAAELSSRNHLVDATLVNECRNTVLDALAAIHSDRCEALFDTMKVEGPYSPAAQDAGQRALQGVALSLISRQDGGALATQSFETADNMTQSQAALTNLIRLEKAEKQLATFYGRWKSDKLVTDKWFALQAIAAPSAHAVETTNALSQHADFQWKNPNRFRSLFGGFASNQAAFHRADGAGYTLLTDWLIKLDAVNPQTTARMVGLFETWRRNTKDRQEKIAACLDRIASNPDISKDTAEIIGKIRAAK
ncbi:MAG: aminopeptidase N [Pseudomonadota bacterium]